MSTQKTNDVAKNETNEGDIETDNTGGDKNDKTKDDSDPNNASGSTDGFIGSRRIRTFLIGGLLIAYSLLTMIYFFRLPKVLPPFNSFLSVLIGISLLVLLGGCAAAIVLHCLKREGGIETIVGWVVLISSLVIAICNFIISFSFRGFGAYFFVFIGEGSLAGVTGVFLGLDIVKDFMSKEGRRLFSNLLLLSIVSCCCMIGYYNTAKFFGGAYVLIGIGYMIIAISSIVYCVLNFCSCCTYGKADFDKNCLVRLTIAGGLILGGVLAAIGYWSSTVGRATYALGMSILIGGVCVTWALDMGIVDTVKEAKNSKK